MKKRKKALFCLPIVIWPIWLLASFLFIVCSWSAADTLPETASSGQGMIVWLIITAVLWLIQMIYPYLLPKLGFSARDLLFWTMLNKLCFIPIFVSVFVVGFVSALFPLWGIFIVAPIMVFDYLLLLSTSMYGVSGLVQAQKKDCIPKNLGIACLVLQFFFCTDVIASVVAYVQVRRTEKATVPLGAAEAPQA